MKKVSIAATASLALCTAVSAAELKVLSAGAVQPGLNVAARIFHDRTGEDATIAYSPATDLGKRVGGGEIADNGSGYGRVRARGRPSGAGRCRRARRRTQT